MSEESTTVVKGLESKSEPSSGDKWNSDHSLTNGSVNKISDSGSSLPEVEMQFSGEKSMFQSAIGAVVSCLGSAVGTGNIWRFPRIVATHSYSKGSLTFYIVWILVLFIWSIPIIVIEYALGRFCQVSAPLAFVKFLGPKFFWVGGWMVAVVFFLGAYYPVILGWCLYYLFISCTASQLPTNEHEGNELFNNYAMHSYWPVLTQFLAVALTGGCLAGGIKWIEKANIVLVPMLLAIVIFTFGWSLTREYAEVGISFLFTPSWSSFAEPSLWIAAAGQNAFDTGAGMSVLATYATFMTKSSGIVSYSFLIPIINNVVSFYASITVFSTVFSTIIQTNPTATRSAILKIMQHTGPGSTGLTFTWIPVLFSKVGIFGRVLCALFFLCLVFAGISSLLSLIQCYVLTIKEFKVPHRIAVSVALIATFLFGLPSSIFLDFLTNQDNTWGYGLIISGFLFSVLVIYYGPLRFRRVLINQFGENDWKLPIIWVPIIMFLVPFQTVALIIWWIYDYIRSNSEWYLLSMDSLTTIFLEWGLVLIALLILNLILYRTNLLTTTLEDLGGCDPYDPSTYEDPATLKTLTLEEYGNDVFSAHEPVKITPF